MSLLVENYLFKTHGHIYVVMVEVEECLFEYLEQIAYTSKVLKLF